MDGVDLRPHRELLLVPAPLGHHLWPVGMRLLAHTSTHHTGPTPLADLSPLYVLLPNCLRQAVNKLPRKLAAMAAPHRRRVCSVLFCDRICGALGSSESCSRPARCMTLARSTSWLASARSISPINTRRSKDISG